MTTPRSHSILLGSWAEGGVLAAFLPAWLLVACIGIVWNNTRFGKWAPLALTVALQGIWDLLYAPWTYNMLAEYACIALLFCAVHFRGPPIRAMTPTVSAVIPTIGRPSLGRAVQSVLDQTQPVAEIIVVADTDGAVPLPSDDRIHIAAHRVSAAVRPMQTAGNRRGARHGDRPARRRRRVAHHQAGAAAGGRRFHQAGTHWIASSRMAVLGPGTRRRIWPRRLIEPGESIDASICFGSPNSGSAAPRCKPRRCAFRPNSPARSAGTYMPAPPHDEPSWLIRVQRTIPDLRVVQLPDVLSTYNVRASSVSRDTSDRTDSASSGDCSTSIGVAARAGRLSVHQSGQRGRFARSLGGVRRSMRSALRHGRPGPFALAYAVLNAARIIVHSAGSAHR